MNACVHAYMHVYMDVYMYACMDKCIYVCMCACMNACMYKCIYARIRACGCRHVCLPRHLFFFFSVIHLLSFSFRKSNRDYISLEGFIYFSADHTRIQIRIFSVKSGTRIFKSRHLLFNSEFHSVFIHNFFQFL